MLKYYQIQSFTMDARKVYDDVINFVEKSCLNYSILRTPFSAKISIKSSFIKRFNDVPDSDLNVAVNREEETISKKLLEENAELKEKLYLVEAELEKVTNLEKQIEEATREKEEFENLYVNERIKSKDLENQIGDLRSDLVKVKVRERNLIRNVKYLRMKKQQF